MSTEQVVSAYSVAELHSFAFAGYHAVIAWRSIAEPGKKPLPWDMLSDLEQQRATYNANEALQNRMDESNPVDRVYGDVVRAMARNVVRPTR